MALQPANDQNGAGATGATLTARQEFGAHWKVVAASFVGLMFGAWAMPLYLLGPFTKSFETALGWQRSDIIYCTTFLAVGGTLGNPLVGVIVDRTAPRAVALVSLLVIAVCLASFSLLQGNVLEAQLLFLAMGFFGAGSGGVPFTRAIGAWFRKGRGFALGIALCGTASAAFAAPLLAQKLISLVGWRPAFVCIGALVVIVAMPVVTWGLRTPKLSELSPGEPGPDLHGVTRAQAMRDPRFYILALSIGLFGIFISSIVFNNVPMLIDKGMAPARAAQIASLMGIAMMVGRLIIGWFLDRFPPALVGATIFLLGAAGTLIFVVGGTPFAVLMVVATGFLLGAEVDLLSYLALRFFGPRHYGEIFGLLFASYTLFSMVGPKVNNLLIARGGYDAMFIGTTAGFLTSGLMLLGLAFSKRAESRAH